jgi:exopolysaccharide biosynthesis polyprenyl glycosylphosphotransferase
MNRSLGEWHSQLPADIRAPHRLRIAQVWRRELRWVLVLLASDGIALAIAGNLANYFNQFYAPLPPQLVLGDWLGVPVIYWLLAMSVVVLFARRGLYTSASQWKNYARVGKLVTLVYLGALVLVYLIEPRLAPPRSLVLTAWISSVGLIVGFRLFLRLVARGFEPAHTAVFLLASADRLPRLAKVLQRRSSYRVVGAGLATTASSAATWQMILASGAQEVLAENLPQTELASGLFWQLRRAGITLRLIPSSVEMLHRRGEPEVIAGLPTLRMEATTLGGWDYRLKRVIDVVGAGIGLILLSPVLIAIAFAIKLSSPGAILFSQERVGLHGKPFRMWKFRTMVPNAAALQAALEQQNEAGDGVLFKLKHDPRVTPIGQFLRRTSLDELPQLLNVLMGQMSLVGPRPLPLRDVERFDPWHHTRHQVLPGMTGLWQVSGRSTIEAFNDAARLDLYYIDNWSLNLDLDILLETIKVVVFGKGAY